jgi:hypothetical protein
VASGGGRGAPLKAVGKGTKRSAKSDRRRGEAVALMIHGYYQLVVGAHKMPISYANISSKCMK